MLCTKLFLLCMFLSIIFESHRSLKNTRARICKRLRSPGIYIAYVAWRAGTSNRVVASTYQAGKRFLGSIKGIQIRSQAARLLMSLICGHLPFSSSDRDSSAGGPLGPGLRDRREEGPLPRPRPPRPRLGPPPAAGPGSTPPPACSTDSSPVGF